ncbi:TniB family NTP-binding protein [Aliiroseovarius sp. F47248L]|uniref:TniB family NTP-binding protein n=1 Tax=Aliiroseovarius sp. F47248L TaxID=2926420 RepID=UPI001FF31E31|nr:TniB family NTP-binding protein [Aliiroseovarius sp. F47248L]MCK0137943.1 TniB family NTP-binding protein [Aliiroseovarius sp. F47248L]
MNEMKNNIPVSLTEKLAWLDQRYWKFGVERDFEDSLIDIFKMDDDGQRTAEPHHDPLTDETKGLMVLGQSGNGKTALLKRALRVDPVLTEFKVNEGGNALYIAVPPEATIKKLGEIILAKTGYEKVNPKLRAADSWEMARHRFGLVGIKALIIDECHHIFRAGAGRDRPAAIQALKHIVQSEHRVALIIAGVPSLRTAIMSEESGETFRRFSEYTLSKIRPGSRSAATFGKNFMKCAGVMGVKVAEEDAIAERILFAEQGQIGKSVALGKDILRAALMRKQDAITLAAAERVYRKSNSGLDVTPFDGGDWDAVRTELTAIGWGQS